MSLDLTKLPVLVLRNLRESYTDDPDSRSADDEISELSAKEAFTKAMNWEGIHGYDLLELVVKTLEAEGKTLHLQDPITIPYSK